MSTFSPEILKHLNLVIRHTKEITFTFKTPTSVPTHKTLQTFIAGLIQDKGEHGLDVFFKYVNQKQKYKAILDHLQNVYF